METLEQTIEQLDRADRNARWRLILGRAAEATLGAGAALAGGMAEVDVALGALYEDERPEHDEDAPRRGGLGASAPKLARWLGDIRKYFPESVVAVIQKDAIERKGLSQLLFEPEVMAQITPSVDLAATILSLKGAIPEQTKETAREVVRKVAEEIVQRLRSQIERSVRGALDRSRHAAAAARLDVRRTIRRNLKNYDRERRALIVDRTYFFARQHRQFEWNVIVCLDQSGSMASSIVYGAVTASILASLPSLRTHLVAFDTQVVDLTERCHDPVVVLFGIQLGGGTDINSAMTYCQTLVTEPRKTLLILVSDLEEGGNANALLSRIADLVASGVKVVSLLALSDQGTPGYSHEMARKVRALDVPAFACTPNLIPLLLEAALRGDDLAVFPSRHA